MADLDDGDGKGAGCLFTITPEVLRGLRAMACALTARQAEHPDVRTACEWLLSGLTAVDRDRLRMRSALSHWLRTYASCVSLAAFLSAVVDRVIDEIEGKIGDEEVR